MFNLISRINQYLSLVRKKQLIFLFILIIFLSLTEAISLASIIPFIGVFMNPDFFFSSPWLSFFINFFEINDNDQLFLLVTIIFISLLILSFLIRIFTIYLTNKITYFIEADLKIKIFKYNINQSYSYHLKKSSYIVMSNIVQKTNTIAIFTNSFIQILSCSLTVLFILGVLLIIEPFIILSVSSVVIFFFIFIAFLNRDRILKNS